MEDRFFAYSDFYKAYEVAHNEMKSSLTQEVINTNYGQNHKLYLATLFNTTLTKSLEELARIIVTPEKIAELQLVLVNYPFDNVKSYLDTLYNIEVSDEYFKNIHIQYQTSLFCVIGYYMRLERTKRLMLAQQTGSFTNKHQMRKTPRISKRVRYIRRKKTRRVNP
jgi:hypothetical protein